MKMENKLISKKRKNGQMWTKICIVINFTQGYMGKYDMAKFIYNLYRIDFKVPTRKTLLDRKT